MLERVFGENLVYQSAPKISVSQLNAASRDDLGEGVNSLIIGPSKNDTVLFYYDLGRSAMKPSVFVDTKSQTRLYSVSCPAIDGGGINALLYYAAPYKRFGLDTDDILDDWDDLFNKNNKARQNAHSKMKDWDVTVKHIGAMRAAIQKWKNGPPELKLNPNNECAITPTIIWRKSPDGQRSWAIEHSFLGVFYAATFSYDVTSKWPKSMGYTENGTTQSMGPTQVVHQAIMLRDELFQGHFLQNLEAHIDNATLA